MAQPTHYDLLGVPQAASTEQIRRAFKDKIHYASPEDFEQLTQAHNILTDAKLRRQYDMELFMRARAEKGPLASTTIRADEMRVGPLSKETRKELAREDMKRLILFGPCAVRGFGLAGLLAIVIAIARLWIAFGGFGSGSSDVDPTLAFIIENIGRAEVTAVSIRPTVEVGHDADSAFEAGAEHLSLSSATGDAEETLAIGYFELAIRIDPDHVQARRTLGEIYYARWLGNRSDRNRFAALRHLSHYEILVDGEVDAAVLTMLNALE